MSAKKFPKRVLDVGIAEQHMMSMGGGFLSLLQGFLAKENLLGIQCSYFVGVACFIYLAYYGWKAKQILRSQGIDYDATASSS